MSQRAQVTSVEAIDAFRGSLLVYIAKARAALDEIEGEKQHTRVWLETDRRSYWEREYRQRSRKLEEAQQELFSAKVSRLGTHTAAQVLAVERAKQAVQQAEEKRDLVKRWSREFETLADPLVKQLEPLQGFLTRDLPKAAAYLASILKALEAYTAVPMGGGVIPSSPVSPPEPTEQSGEGADRPAETAPSAGPGHLPS